MENEMPKLSTLATLYYADSDSATKVQIGLTEEIPQLEEAPEQVTGSALDIDYEFSEPGKAKAGTIEIPIYYTHTQHRRLKQIERVQKVFFVKYPESTAPSGEEPLVKRFEGCLTLVGDSLPDGDWIKDILTIYKTSRVTEIYGLPATTATTENNT